MWLDTETLATLPEMIAETFVDAAHEHARARYEQCARGAGLVVKSLTGKRSRKGAGDWTHGDLAQRRPDGLLERVREALPEQEIWTASSMLARLEMPNTHGELCSVAKAIQACGWHKRPSSSRDAGRWEYRQHKHSDEGTVQALLAADQRAVWAVNDLSQITGINARHVGMIMTGLGWRRRRRMVQNRMVTEYCRGGV